MRKLGRLVAASERGPEPVPTHQNAAQTDFRRACITIYLSVVNGDLAVRCHRLMMRSFLRNGSKHYGTSSSRERHDHVRLQTRNKAIASFARKVEPIAGDEPDDGREVAQTRDSRGHDRHWPE